MLGWVTRLFTAPDERHTPTTISESNLRHYLRTEMVQGWADGPYWPLRTNKGTTPRNNEREPVVQKGGRLL